MVHPRLPLTLRSSFLAATSRRKLTHSRPTSALALHVIDSTLGPNSEDTLQDSHIDGLHSALLNASSPTRIWAYYTNFINYFGYDALPLEMHRQVLRQCSPPARTLRLFAARHLLEGRKPEYPHLHEGRFQTVISNIRALAHSPSLEDYHFILEQFAAVGHYVGSLQVYQEITHLGLTPEPKTFGLCLQSIAHRLTLPILKLYRPRLAAQSRKILDDLLSDMRKHQIPLTQSNLDLILRLFKETVDKKGFDTLVKWAYGVDFDNPDCPPIELLENRASPQPPPTQPLSTNALNTIIDTLGRFGDISKLVQAFEVLTQPVLQANQHRFSSFDGEDDFGVPVEVPNPPHFTPPYAQPNTTTYNMLLRHLAKADHAVLARHYLIQAIRLDRQVNRNLQRQLRSGETLEHIKAPNFSLNRRMFLSIFGHTNRYKNLSLMRWLSTKLPRIQKYKKMDLQFYSELRERLGAPNSMHLIDADAETQTAPVMATSLPSQDFARLLPRVAQVQRRPSPKIIVDLKNMGTAFDVDVNEQSVPEVLAEKIFDLDLHIDLLTRDIGELSAFASTLDEVLGRTAQRKKEQLGRRVWTGKDIYLSTEDQRKVISRERWRDIVHFKPRRELIRRSQFSSLRSRDPAPHLVLRATQQDPLSTTIGVTVTSGNPSLSKTWLPTIRSILLPERKV